ncbi:FtsX-like permease family protein [Exiguobacterium sp.]|uniref:ABC transporter permease n=1 Tax=Exiguobacterium sp. TaxID=44751 RepID=UPI00263B28E5|nr:FtsX-like permease family protein [Exiguobacterium sp.]MCC5892218.1 ABC transporter permease [Exiguobacterium sp.]
MNIIQKMTMRHLRENKRRSLVTIIGVIISVSMITAVTTLGSSFLDLMIRQDIADNGEWHVKYVNTNAEQVEAIRGDAATKDVILSSDGYAELEGSQNAYRPYVYIRNYNTSGLKNFPVDLTEGRLPKREGEVVISEAIRQNALVTYNIGDQLTLDIGERMDDTSGRELTQNDGLIREGEDVLERLKVEDTVTLTVVGTMARPAWEPTWAPGYTVVGFIDDKALNGSTVDTFVALNDVSNSIYEKTDRLMKEQGIEGVAYNTSLLRYYGVTDDGGLRKTLYGFAGIIMAVIVIGSISLIYNAFAISVSERSRYLGMLASVGATKRQKRNSVYFEGLIIGGISIPIGILAGVTGIGVTFLFINAFAEKALNLTEKFEVVVTPVTLMLTILISSVTIFISCYLPARRASKISAIDAIRQSQDVRLTSKNVKTSKLVRRIFGLEAEIGLKNTKRNRKRYLATVFSLVISIVLFLVVSYFTDRLEQSLEMSQGTYEFDILVNGANLNTDDLRRYETLDDVTNGTYFENTTVRTLVNQTRLPDTILEQEGVTDSFVDGEYDYYVSLYQLDDKSFDDYLKQIGASASDFADGEIPSAVLIDEVSYQDFDKKKFVTSKTIETKLGDTLELRDENATDEAAPLKIIKIAAMTDVAPTGVMTSSLGWLDVIVREGTFGEDAIGNLLKQSSPSIALNTNDPDATQQVIEAEQNMDQYIFNVSEQREQQEQVLLLLSIFVYGFIVLISLISVANIFNTISTSVSLRRREFAMLRSVGMTPKGFNKMVYYESIFYGVKALAYGLPISVLIMYLIYRAQINTFEAPFSLPWGDILFVTVVIFLIVGSSMLYAISKVKSDNIIDRLKQENN